MLPATGCRSRTAGQGQRLREGRRSARPRQCLELDQDRHRGRWRVAAHVARGSQARAYRRSVGRSKECTADVVSEVRAPLARGLSVWQRRRRRRDRWCNAARTTAGSARQGHRAGIVTHAGRVADPTAVVALHPGEDSGAALEHATSWGTWIPHRGYLRDDPFAHVRLLVGLLQRTPPHQFGRGLPGRGLRLPRRRPWGHRAEGRGGCRPRLRGSLTRRGDASGSMSQRRSSIRFAACHAVFRPGGALVLGINELLGAVDVATMKELARFASIRACRACPRADHGGDAVPRAHAHLRPPVARVGAGSSTGALRSLAAPRAW